MHSHSEPDGEQDVIDNKNGGRATTGMVFNMQSYSIHDGPGIRTVVFLKGCPLCCLWCCNPESISGKLELGFRQTFCNGCTQCMEVCPQKALSLQEGTNALRIERTLCNNCGACVEACPRQALTIYGQRMTVKEVVDEVLKDGPFYRRSGGGVTISGGEPLTQPDFLLSILEGCRQAGLHTAIETSGYCSPQVLSRVLGKVDLFLFDLKVMDSKRHLELTGKRNHLILNNARMLAKAGYAVQPRMPLIPGVNDSMDNLSMLASFLHSIGCPSIELMPYHQFGRSKYAALGKPYKMGDVPSAKPEDVKRVNKMLKRDGVECWAST
jgi:pyruvate formate lyase activating enzyme